MQDRYMADDEFVIPRVLVNKILHEAQVALPDVIHGWIYANENGVPCAYRSAQQDMNTHKADQVLWARLWSDACGPGEPPIEELRPHVLNAVVALNTKGVLELRIWNVKDGKPSECRVRAGT